MPSIAFLSTDKLEDFFVYDDMLIAPFRDRDWHVQTISWHDKTIDWNTFDYVIVRSTWDYQQHAVEFQACLATIESSSATLLNPFALMQWNIEKTYLKDMQNQGVDIVPTVWSDTFNVDFLQAQFSHFDTSTLVIKPILSANADDTFKITRANLSTLLPTLTSCFNTRKHMVQPFAQSIVDEGEYSLFYFNHAFSHGILKTPATGDFRVQEEHGGQLRSIQPTEDMLNVATQSLEAMPSRALYARVDLVRIKDKWSIMELELIEPSLYFNLDKASPERFVQAMVDWHLER
ncbi:hypothetical protein [Alteromonas sp. KUL49]|uniref:ATP-grasp domain-containing protein n=1 Tax=Alteromonas sp. KUL49 TaxID=2480798 RepID=UPI00102EEE58|nr:hypothetical protein [Alteromonas sp. KUL49]TAP39332.1 hypothetical protein EYS00_12415 [Alteromonas sp. KUL49]GEA12126.1 transporter [Alteromonas sp. KUL49]